MIVLPHSIACLLTVIVAVAPQASAQASHTAPCARPDSASAPSWFWQPDVYSPQFSPPQVDTIELQTARGSRRAVNAAAGRFELTVVTLTREGPTLPESAELTLRPGRAADQRRVVGPDLEDLRPYVLVGATSLWSKATSVTPVEAILYDQGLEFSIGEGLIGEDGPTHFHVVESSPTDARGWWRPGSSLVPPPHGYFCLHRLSEPPDGSS